RIMGLNYVERFAASLNEIKRGRGICSIRKVSLLTFFNAHRENRFTIEARNIICIIRMQFIFTYTPCLFIHSPHLF
ncbi:hypothetical protein AB4562_19995, partial [Vibrio sp. 10N.222.54.A1]|uniref:hypothetical protein n=1 Tax=unclassified Vibrio TaxID=2614977 RepID=UPI00354AD54C